MDGIVLKKMNSETKNEMHLFLAKESLKLYFELNPKWKEIIEKDPNIFKQYLEQIVDDFKGDELVYGAYFNDEIIGCGYINDENCLDSLFVKEEYRNLGVGSSLLEKLIKTCDETKTITLHANIRAVSLYERYSFHKTGDVVNKCFVPMERKTNYGK